MRLHEQGEAKYGADDLLASSSNAAWNGLAAEHRRHRRGEVPSFQPQSLEIAIATACHPDCVVSRSSDRIRQHTRVEPGTIWFCPAGVLEEDIVVAEWHDAIHLFLPPERFEQLSNERGGAAYRQQAVPYLGGIYHEGMRRIGSNLIAELSWPGAATSVLIDTLSLQLTACIVDNHSSDGGRLTPDDRRHRLDSRRLRRVLDYMTAHLEDDVGLDALADAACFSPFHFIRVFSNTMGMPPHRYLSRLRLERAKTMLAIHPTPISQIAAACCFSSQTNFTRAFHRATGFTPLKYRQHSA